MCSTDSKIAAGLTSLFLFASSAGLSAQTLANPGFEAPAGYTGGVGYMSQNGGAGSIPGWTESNFAQQGINSVPMPFANNGTIPEGVQVGFIQTNANTNTFSNTITGLTAGETYELSFRVNARNGQQVRMHASVGGDILQWALVNSVGGANEYSYYVRTFEATDDEMALVISSSSTVDQTLLIDDFKVAPKPESPWSTAAWTNDADSGIDPDGDYTHAYNLGGAATALDATINGIPFTGVGGGNPAVAGSFSLTGPGAAIPNDPNNVTDDGGSRTVANTFVYNGFPATLTLEGLTPGQRYRTSVFAVGWDDNTTSNRSSTFEAGGERITVDASFYNNNNGIRVDYEFDAGAATEIITVDPLGGNSFHFYGFANVLVDSLTIAAAPVEFSRFVQGDLVSTLSAFNNAVPEAATFVLAPGGGDADNNKFQIVDDEIQIGLHDFGADADGSTYSIRVGATGLVSGAMVEKIFALTKIDDVDGDSLPDAWELLVTDTGGGGNLTDLKGDAAGPGPGRGTGNFDGDSLTDLEEFEIDQTTFPGINPLDDDTDGDDLEDGSEILGAGERPPTSPTDADTDDDSLTDGQESNSGDYADADDTGTDPTNADTDADGYRDAFDILRGGDPTDPALVPVLAPAVALVALTDDASTGIDVAKTYTHAISGGGAATINGVAFEDFSPTVTPANFGWDTGGMSKSQIPLSANNLGAWNSAAGGVTGPGLLQLLGGFTYSGSGANAGSMQTFTLSGLTPGQAYLLRLYVRVWSTAGSGRPADISFTNGATIEYAPILEDRPEIMLGGGASPHTAYALEYSYVASGSELVISSSVPVGAASPSGSYHLYGLTNEIGGPPVPAEITDIAYDPDAEPPTVIITFNGIPNKDYALDFSTTLTSNGAPGGWNELDDSVRSTGQGSVVEETNAAQAFETVFYRLRDPELQPDP